MSVKCIYLQCVFATVSNVANNKHRVVVDLLNAIGQSVVFKLVRINSPLKTQGGKESADLIGHYLGSSIFIIFNQDYFCYFSHKMGLSN